MMFMTNDVYDCKTFKRVEPRRYGVVIGGLVIPLKTLNFISKIIFRITGR